MSKILHPKIAPYKEEWIRVSDNHQLYLEQAGNPDGIPVLYLHGGPGSGCSENHRRYFDPEKYRYVSFDQRGAGRSKPAPSTEDNDTQLLIEDIEVIRKHLNIDKWLLVGGSWGTTLAMLYGIQYSKHVIAFILRGVFLGMQSELDWLYQSTGVARFFPDYFKEFIAPLDLEKQQGVLQQYAEIFDDDNEVAMSSACKAWYLWELRLSSLEHSASSLSSVEDFHQAACMAQISNHYFINHCFIEENYIIENISKISHIPAIIIHGRYDMVCQLSSAYQLVEAWDNASLQILPQAGHSGFESQTIDAMCKATELMASFLQD